MKSKTQRLKDFLYITEVPKASLNQRYRRLVAEELLNDLQANILHAQHPNFNKLEQTNMRQRHGTWSCSLAVFILTIIDTCHFCLMAGNSPYG